MQKLALLDWNEVLFKIQNFATSELSKLEISETVPLESKEFAQKSFQDIFEATEVINTGLRPHATSLDFYSQWSPRLQKKAVLKNLEIKDIRLFCLELLALREALSPLSSNWAADLQTQLMEASEPLSAIDQILTPAGEIRIDASEKLYNLTREKERLGRDLLQSLERLVKDHKMEGVVQDKFVTTRDGRWVVPVRSGAQHHLPGVIHGSSQSKQTVFMEPEKVVPVNNRLRQIEVEIEDEIERILTDLSHYLHGLFSEFSRSRDLLQSADVRLAQAQFTLLAEAQPIEFSDETIDLIEVRHPLLQLSEKKIIANTVLLNQEKSILLLSGPNAGGKTVLLKSIGLAAQMARCGLPICASETSRLPFFKSIHIGIGDAQSVDENLSTFAAHLKVLSQAASMKGSDSLILIDEICGSTDPEEGSALARAFIEQFSANQSFAIITSHLGPLKLGWDESSRVLNGSLEYDTSTGRPTYHFIAGIPGDSLAIQTAKRVGIPQALVERALAILAPATRARLEGLEQIEQLKSDINLLQENLRQETKKALQLKDKYEGMLAQFEKEKEVWLSRTLKKAERKVEEALSEAKAAQALERHRNLQEIKSQLPEIVKAKPIQTSPTETAEEFGKRFPPGTKIYVPSLQADGLVQSLPNGKGEVIVMSGSIRLQLPWKELRPSGKPTNPTAQLVRRSSSVTVAIQEDERVIDLRGKTVDEALEDLEIQLDRAAESREDRVKIIHGHGTEALKKAVRTYLSRSVYVKKWKAGSPETGGDGMTWAELGS